VLLAVARVGEPSVAAVKLALERLLTWKENYIFLFLKKPIKVSVVVCR